METLTTEQVVTATEALLICPRCCAEVVYTRDAEEVNCPECGELIATPEESQCPQ
jgi:ribosomal protein S27E